MFEFWLSAILLFLLAFSFILIPCIRYLKKKDSNTEISADDLVEERIQQNVQIYKERLSELDNDKSSGAITQTEYAQLKEELDRSLVDDADGNQQAQRDATLEAGPASVWPIAIICLSLVLLIGAGTYLKYGAYDDVVLYLDNAEQNAELAKATEQAKNGDMSALLEQLHGKLIENPENINGWSLLARTALNTERYALAIEGFEQVIRLIKKEQNIDSEYLAATYGILAQSHYYSSNGKISQSVQSSIDQALALNPNEPSTLSLLAIDAFGSANYEKAIAYWKKVLEAYPTHPASASIKQGINEAQKRAGFEVTDFSTSIQGPSIRVNVSLDNTFLKSVAPDDTVFIFIKDASMGDAPSPPLAASRHTVSELPISITLSDMNAMSPMAKLSDAKNVNVIARVSKSGQVSSTSGDIQGSINQIEVNGEQEVSIAIDTEIK